MGKLWSYQILCFGTTIEDEKRKKKNTVPTFAELGKVTVRPNSIGLVFMFRPNYR